MCEKTQFNDLPLCAKKCIECNVSCPNEDCRKWIDYEEEHNCCLISIEEKQKGGSEKGLTLHEVGDRLRLSYLKVRQIEINALKKLVSKKELKQFIE